MQEYGNFITFMWDLKHMNYEKINIYFTEKFGQATNHESKEYALNDHKLLYDHKK